MKPIRLSAPDLEAFLAVSETASFRAAAKILGISQPSVSTRVQHAEDVLGMKLFHRTTRKVVITDAGERLRVRAQRTLAELRAILEEFRDEAHLRRGRVDIAVTPTLSGTVMPPVIQSFKRRWPGVQLVVHDDLFGRALGRVVSGEVDLAVMPRMPGDPLVNESEFNFSRLFVEQFFVLMPHDHELARRKSVSPRDLRGVPLTSMPSTSSHWEAQSASFARAGMEFNPEFVTTNILSMIGFVRAGLCLAILPKIIFPLLNMEQLVALPTDRITGREIGILTARERTLIPAAEALHKLIQLTLGVSTSRG
jgi:DNA-binding transcriptional LysR family regulator